MGLAGFCFACFACFACKPGRHFAYPPPPPLLFQDSKPWNCDQFCTGATGWNYEPVIFDPATGGCDWWWVLFRGGGGAQAHVEGPPPPPHPHPAPPHPHPPSFPRPCCLHDVQTGGPAPAAWRSSAACGCTTPQPSCCPAAMWVGWRGMHGASFIRGWTHVPGGSGRAVRPVTLRIRRSLDALPLPHPYHPQPPTHTHTTHTTTTSPPQVMIAGSDGTLGDYFHVSAAPAPPFLCRPLLRPLPSKPDAAPRSTPPHVPRSFPRCMAPRGPPPV